MQKNRDNLRNKNIKFSLILATINRFDEVDKFLLSITCQTINKHDFEIIIVDQNQNIDLSPIIKKFELKLNIKHLKSNQKGQSINRNLGILHSNGETICFPDDDCTYYPDTIQNVLQVFQNNPNVTTVLGQITDRNKNLKIIRNWSDKNFEITKMNFFTNYSMITIFTKNKQVFFDEMFGVGEKFGAYEDADYLLNLIESGKTLYSPDISVWHPELNIQTMSIQKIKNYSMGFGAFCKKHLSIGVLYLFVKAIGFHFLKLIHFCILFNHKECTKRFYSVKYRLKGFSEYKRAFK